MDIFTNQLVELLLPVCMTILTAVFAFIGSKINSFIKSKNMDRIIPYVVKYVEQVYVDVKGEEKLEKATIMASLLLKEKGITISDEALHVMIEAACYELKVNLTK